MSAMMTICNPGDKVMVFSPFYENYGADAILSGAEPIYIPLVPPTYEFDINLVEEGFKAGRESDHRLQPVQSMRKGIYQRRADPDRRAGSQNMMDLL